MPAIAIAGIGAASSIAGGIMGSSAANNAAQTAADGQIKAAQISADSQQKMYNTTRADQLPYLTGGAGALGRLDYLLGLPGQQSSTKAAYGAGFGPQGSSYIPSNGGAPVVSGPYGPAGGWTAADFKPGGMAYQQLNTPGVRGGGKAAQYGNGDSPVLGQQLTSAQAKAAATQTVASPTYMNDPSYGSLMKDFSSQDFQTDPGYAFRLSEGQKALDRSAAARGGLFSGETLKANDQYNQNFASNEYQNAYNRYQNNRTTKYNFLSNAAGGGQIAANNLGNVGAQYAGNIGNALQQGYGNAANARAAGYAASGSAWNNAISGVGNAIGSGYEYYKAHQDTPPMNVVRI